MADLPAPLTTKVGPYPLAVWAGLIGGVVWDMALAEHFEALDDGRAIDVTGEGGTHGRRGRYAKGCRCIPCSLTAVMPDGALAKIRTKTAA